jgi:hypothetical protein
VLRLGDSVLEEPRFFLGFAMGFVFHGVFFFFSTSLQDRFCNQRLFGLDVIVQVEWIVYILASDFVMVSGFVYRWRSVLLVCAKCFIY